MSVVYISPASFVGGKWEQITSHFLLAADDVSFMNNTYGGEYSHTLTIEEMPAHRHEVISTPLAVADQAFVWGNENLRGAGSSMWTTEVGAGLAHNNIPPYYAVYMWKRVG